MIWKNIFKGTSLTSKQNFQRTYHQKTYVATNKKSKETKNQFYRFALSYNFFTAYGKKCPTAGIFKQKAKHPKSKWTKHKK